MPGWHTLYCAAKKVELRSSCFTRVNRTTDKVNIGLLRKIHMSVRLKGKVHTENRFTKTSVMCLAILMLFLSRCCIFMAHDPRGCVPCWCHTWGRCWCSYSDVYQEKKCHNVNLKHNQVLMNRRATAFSSSFFSHAPFSSNMQCNINEKSSIDVMETVDTVVKIPKCTAARWRCSLTTKPRLGSVAIYETVSTMALTVGLHERWSLFVWAECAKEEVREPDRRKA